MGGGGTGKKAEFEICELMVTIVWLRPLSLRPVNFELVCISGWTSHKYDFCRDKTSFVATKLCLPRKKTRLAATKLCLSRQMFVCRDKNIFVTVSIVLS